MLSGKELSSLKITFTDFIHYTWDDNEALENEDLSKLIPFIETTYEKPIPVSITSLSFEEIIRAITESTLADPLRENTCFKIKEIRKDEIIYYYYESEQLIDIYGEKYFLSA